MVRATCMEEGAMNWTKEKIANAKLSPMQFGVPATEADQRRFDEIQQAAQLELEAQKEIHNAQV